MLCYIIVFKFKYKLANYCDFGIFNKKLKFKLIFKQIVNNNFLFFQLQLLQPMINFELNFQIFLPIFQKYELEKSKI